MVEDDEKILCDRCGGLITPEDILTGLAIKIEDELICPACIDMLPARTKVQINRLRAMHGLNVTTYRLIDPELPNNRLYTFTNTAALIQHRRKLKTEEGFEAPLLTDAQTGGQPPAAPPTPVPAPFSRLPRTTRYALVAIGVLLGALLAFMVLPTGGRQEEDEETRAEEANRRTEQQELILAQYLAMDPLEAWRQAQDDDRLSLPTRDRIGERLIERKREDLDLAAAALDVPHYTEARALLDRTPLPPGVEFSEIKQRERELRERLRTAIEPPPEEVEPPPEEVEPPIDTSVLARHGSSGKEAWLEGMAGWVPERDGIRSRSFAASFSRELRPPPGDWRLWIQGYCPDEDETPTIKAVLGGTELSTDEEVTSGRSTWLSFAPSRAVPEPAEGEERQAVRLTIHVTGEGWFIKRIVLADPRIPTDGELAIDRLAFLDWVRPRPEPPDPADRPPTPVAFEGGRLDSGKLLHRFDDRNLVGPQAEVLTSLPSNVPVRIVASNFDTLALAEGRSKPQMVDISLPEPIDVSGGGLVLHVHPNRSAAGSLGVRLGDRTGRTWRPDRPWSFTAEESGSWQSLVVATADIPPSDPDEPGFDPRAVTRITVFDTDPAQTFPFYLAKATARAGAPATPTDLDLLPRALRNTTTASLDRLVREVGLRKRWSPRRVYERFDPLRVKFLVGANLNAGWRTAFRKRLVPLFGVRESADLPRNLVQTMVWQNQWLDATFIKEHLRNRDHHLVVVMTAGAELQIGLTKRQALLNFWDKMAAEATRSGFLPVVVLGPSKVDPRLEATADELWDELERHVRRKHRHLPIIDLRPVEARDSLHFERDNRELSLDLLFLGYRELKDRIEIIKRMHER